MISYAASPDDFVGRHEELRLLEDEFAIACEERARFVLVEGEAGIGKSRLVREFAERLGDRAIVGFGACAEQIRRPYLPFDQAFERFARRPVKLPPLREDATHPQERAAYFEAVGETLRREASRRPVAVVVEDAQWADDASLDLLRYLAGSIRNARLMIAVTLRSDGLLQNAPLSALRSAMVRVRGSIVNLRGLRRHDVKNLATKIARAHGVDLPPELVAKIEALSDGNPLFAEELTRIALENGEIALSNALPVSAHAMLSERLAIFSESERALLTRAAIVGQRFDAGFVAEIANAPLDDVLTTAQRAVERDLLIAYREEPHRFTFRHTLIRQALADRLVVGLAAPLHLRIAQALEHGQQAPQLAAELAYHYSEARVPAKARYYNELAAQAAWDVYAYRDAIRFYSAALDWEYPSGAQRAAIFLRLGTLLYIDGIGEEPARWFEKALHEYESIGDDAGAARAWLMIGDQRWVDAKTSESARAASEAAARFDRLGDAQQALLARLSLARYAITLGHATAALAQLRALASSLPAFDAVLGSTFYEVRAEARAAAGQTRGALADGAKAAALAVETGSSELLAQVENNVALVAADLGELELATHHHERALAEARRTGLMWRVAYCALNYAQTLSWRGDLVRARACAIEALDCGVTTATFKTKAAAVGIPLALMLNDRALLAACADESALRRARESQELQRIAATGAAFAELAAARGDDDASRAILRETLDNVVHGHRAWNLWLAAGFIGTPPDIGLAQALLAASTGRPRMLRAHALLLAALQARAGDDDRAVRLARAARRGFAAMGFRWRAALCDELAGDRETARRSYAEMGAARDAERLAPDAGPVKPAALTARQAQIAELVTRGEMNRSIAALLHISEHTVEHHLTGIFARTGVKSRAALVAWWVGQSG